LRLEKSLYIKNGGEHISALSTQDSVLRIQLTCGHHDRIGIFI
jgi:hypothetical protein